MPDEGWERLEPILLEQYPPATTGRPRSDLRRAINGIIFRLRTGCQWNKLPKIFGDDSTVHRWFQRFVEDNVLKEFWAVLLDECDDLGKVRWKWQSADGCLGKARFGGGENGSEPHRPGEVRDEEESAGRREGRSSRGDDSGSQRARREALHGWRYPRAGF